MAKRKLSMPDLTAAQLKKLVAAKEKIEKLEGRRDALAKELAKIEAEIDKAMASWETGPKKKVRRKKAAKKKVAKKKTAKKKVTKKRATKKKTVKKATRKPAAKKTKMKVVKKAVRKAKGPTLEDVIVKTLGKRKMAFQDLLAAIQKNKQFKSKSKNFANVLRRTLSTSKRVKRVGRGVYQVV